MTSSAMSEKPDNTNSTANGVSSAREAQPQLQPRSNSLSNDPSNSAPSGFSRIFRHRTLKLNMIPLRKVGEAPSVMQSLKAIFLASWLNVLLVFIPLSWALHFALPHSFANRDTIIFVCSFLAIIPLAKLLAFATEELSLRVGQTLAGLINATLGNAVELIVAILALVKCELRIVQASLVGSVLSNLLLVLGMCFFAGGMKYSEQGFGISAVQLNSSLLVISVIAVLLPAAFHFGADAQLPDDQEGHDILAVSRGVAVILLFIYGGYLSFQLYSHTALYQDKGEHSVVTTGYASPKFRMRGIRNFRRRHDLETPATTCTQTPNGAESVESSQTLTPGIHARIEDPAHITTISEHSEEEEEETPSLSIPVVVGLLVVVATLVAVTAEWLVSSIDGMTQAGGISKEFVGIILLPIVGNAAEHVTAVTVSVKDKLNLSLGVAVGSSIQIALFVIPLIVLVGWMAGKPMTLLFDPYESVALFLSVLTVNYCVQDGKSNWLEGFILMCLYLILALTFWFYPGSDPSGVLAKCT